MDVTQRANVERCQIACHFPFCVARKNANRRGERKNNKKRGERKSNKNLRALGL
jgi:hypothetical protein